MTEAIQKVTEQLQQTAQTSGDKAKHSMEDFGAFNKEMHAGAMPSQPVSQGPAAASLKPTAIEASVKPSGVSLGDALTHGMQDARQTYQSKMEEVNKILDKSDGDPLDQRDLLKTMKLTGEMNLGLQVTTNLAKEASQTVEKLSHNQ